MTNLYSLFAILRTRMEAELSELSCFILSSSYNRIIIIIITTTTTTISVIGDLPLSKTERESAKIVGR